MSDTIWRLKRCALFERLSPDELASLERRSRAKKFERGSPVYLPADAADSVLVVATGRVKVCNITPEGKEAILAFIEPGEMFGELSLLGEEDREEYAEAVEHSTLVLISGDVMRELMGRHPEVSLGVTKLIGLRRRRIERRLKSLLYRSNRERLVHLLLELVEQYGRRESEGVLIGVKLSHQDLAGVIGSTRETVTVVLGELQSEGLLILGRRKIVVRDPERLAASVNERLSRAKPPDSPRAARSAEGH